MKKIYLTFLVVLGFMVAFASPTIFTPTLVGPANNQSNAAPNVTLDWVPVVGNPGLQYIIQLSQDTLFANYVEFTTELSRISMANLKFGEVYYWKVKAIDNTGSSDWTEMRKFTVVSRPILRRPNDGANNVTANVTLQWDEITGIKFFDYQLDTVATFDSPEMYITSVSGALKNVDAAYLKFGYTYHLRLRARHDADTSAWTDSRTFTVLNSFELNKPADGATGLMPDAELQWREVKGITKYTIYVATDPQITHFDIYQATASATRKQPDTLLFGTTYYWRVAAIHPKDTLFSGIRSFTTIENVALSAPANNSTNIELQPLLKWTKITGILSYKIQLDNDPNFGSPYNYSLDAVSASSTESFKIPINVLDSASVYYWRVSALSSRDTSEWSDTWSFRCVALGLNDLNEFVRGVKVYPTPATDQINIQMQSNENGRAELALYDLVGKVKVRREVNVSAGLIRNFALGTLPDGIYMLTIRLNGSNTTAKVIVRK